MTEIRTIPLEQAAPGMTLEAAVEDARGVLLVPRGAELSDSLRSALARRGITHVSVRLPCPDGPAAAARAAAVRERLGYVFRHAAADPLGARLRDAILAVQLEQP